MCPISLRFTSIYLNGISSFDLTPVDWLTPLGTLTSFLQWKEEDIWGGWLLPVDLISVYQNNRPLAGGEISY